MWGQPTKRRGGTSADTRSWLVPAVVGLAVGAGLALLLTPHSGRRMRERLLELTAAGRHQLTGTARFGGGEATDPVALLKARFDEAKVEARRAYDVRRAELVRELQQDRQLYLNAPPVTPGVVPARPGS